MGKSAEAYYAEKLRQLLELQAAQRSNPQLSPPGTRPPRRPPAGVDKSRTDTGRAYYDGFRSRMQQNPYYSKANSRCRQQNTASASAANQQRRPSPPQRNRTIPKSAPGKQQERWDRRPQEEKKRVEAYQRASQGRRRRKLRETLISVALVFGVFVVLCVVTYQLLFVIRNLDATGSSQYTAEEILAACGVDMGDHLYSFSSRVVQERIMLQCPYVAAVDVQRTPPGSISFSIEEEMPMYYGEFYGEFWEISATLRMLDPISETDAQEQGLIKLKLPQIQEAVSGKKIVFANERSGAYMQTVLDALAKSDLAGRISVVDLRSAHNIAMVCDAKYKLLFGNTDVIETKLRLAVAVLEDELFHGDNKASVDLTDLNATSVIIDNQLDLD